MDLMVNVIICCRPTGTDLVEQLEIKCQSLVLKWIVVGHITQVGSMEVTLQETRGLFKEECVSEITATTVVCFRFTLESVTVEASPFTN